MERAGNRRCRHRQDINSLLKLLEPFFVTDPKTLLFIDDEDANLSPDLPPVAYQHVDLPRSQFLNETLPLLWINKTAQHAYGHGKCGESFLERLVVLEGKDRSWRQDCNLFTVTNSFESRPHCDLCLAISHVTADQSIHRDLFLHVGLDVSNCGVLIVGFIELKSVLEFLLPSCVGGKTMTNGHLAFCIELQQFLSHLADGLSDFGLTLNPTRAT